MSTLSLPTVNSEESGITFPVDYSKSVSQLIREAKIDYKYFTNILDIPLHCRNQVMVSVEQVQLDRALSDDLLIKLPNLVDLVTFLSFIAFQPQSFRQNPVMTAGMGRNGRLWCATVRKNIARFTEYNSLFVEQPFPKTIWPKQYIYLTFQTHTTEVQ